MAAYLTLEQFKALTLAAPIRLEEVEVRQPGWILGQLVFYSDLIDSRLRKRYAVPFAASPNTPPVVCQWLTALVTPLVYLKAGISSADEQFVDVKELATLAQAQIKEAADSKDGLFELPLLVGGPNGVTRKGAKAYTEISPYTWRTLQGSQAKSEDGRIG